MGDEERAPLKERLYTVIFEHGTEPGRRFDVALLWAVVLSVVAVLLESMSSVTARYGTLLRAAEWVFTGLFTIEYALRLYCARNRLRYAVSFFGIVDLVAIVPSFISVLIPGAQQLIVIRVLRLLRIFRILKIVPLRDEADALVRAVRASAPKIGVFIFAVGTVVVIVGAAMHVIEGPASGFKDIPSSMYWAIVTVTTVGYGDIAPQTAIGRTLASLLMVFGYGLIAVPTGIVSAEMTRVTLAERRNQRVCQNCGRAEHMVDALHCATCGAPLAQKTD